MWWLVARADVPSDVSYWVLSENSILSPKFPAFVHYFGVYFRCFFAISLQFSYLIQLYSIVHLIDKI